MKESKKVFITTPIFYPNGKPHIGHAYTIVIADFFAKYKREIGYDVVFMTGLDEHGLKIYETSIKENMKVEEFILKQGNNFLELWKKLGIKYDIFLRTTSPNHCKFVQNMFLNLEKKGYIYLDEYSGYYCKIDETYFSKFELLNESLCPICKRETIFLKEKSYFLKTKKFAMKILEDLDKKKYLIPQSSVNELKKNFLESNFTDLSISRTNLLWGIPVPNNEKHTIYVWFDALLSYLSSLEQAKIDNFSLTNVWDKKSKVEIFQFLGKEITRFHAIYWPIILKMNNYKLPKLFAHGWIIKNDEKMSKSFGNAIDPNELISLYKSVDTLKLYFLFQINFLEDGKFSEKIYKDFYNSIMVNKLSNLIYRSFVMLQKYCNLELVVFEKSAVEKKFMAFLEMSKKNFLKSMDEFDFTKAVKKYFEIIVYLNKYIDESKPWLQNDEERQKTLITVFYGIWEYLKTMKIILFETCQKFSNSFNNSSIEESPFGKKLIKIDIFFEKVV